MRLSCRPSDRMLRRPSYFPSPRTYHFSHSMHRKERKPPIFLLRLQTSTARISNSWFSVCARDVPVSRRGGITAFSAASFAFAANKTPTPAHPPAFLATGNEPPPACGTAFQHFYGPQQTFGRPSTIVRIIVFQHSRWHQHRFQVAPPVLLRTPPFSVLRLPVPECANNRVAAKQKRRGVDNRHAHQRTPFSIGLMTAAGSLSERYRKTASR